MKKEYLLHTATVALTLAFSLQPSALICAAPLGTAFTYQGRLTAGGQPANGSYDLMFTLYDDASGDNFVAAPIITSAVGVTNGLFTVTLDFGDGVFTGDARWLEIGVKTNGGASFTSLAPRQPLTPAPYALYAPSAGSAATATTAANVVAGSVGNLSLATGAVTTDKVADGSLTAADLNPTTFSTTFWKADGNSGTAAGTNFLGTTDNQPLEFKVNNQRVLRVENNGTSPNFVGGYSGNSVGANVYGVTINGGGQPGAINSADAIYSTIGGGYANKIRTDADLSTIGGGDYNMIEAASYESTVGGGHNNNIGASSGFATIAGGAGNYIGASSGNATIAGGYYNNVAAYSWSATIAGGVFNDIGTDSQYSAIGGGYDNNIAANSGCDTIAGGVFNDIGTNSYNSAIGGGNDNNIAANSFYATIPGGHANAATNYAFAAGNRAKANHQGSFVWGDSTDADVASTANNQFLIRASGGVRVEGGPIKATGGLIIEVRTSDPPSPAVGQIWLRTDL